MTNKAVTNHPVGTTNREVKRGGAPAIEGSPHAFVDDGGTYVQASLYQSGKVEVGIQFTTGMLKYTLEPAGAVQLGEILIKMGRRGSTIRRNRAW